MCTIKVSENIDANFVITNLILSRREEFTVDDILGISKQMPIIITRKMVERMIGRLRENDYIEEIGMGPSYKIIPENKSMRWMGIQK